MRALQLLTGRISTETATAGKDNHKFSDSARTLSPVLSDEEEGIVHLTEHKKLSDRKYQIPPIDINGTIIKNESTKIEKNNFNFFDIFNDEELSQFLDHVRSTRLHLGRQKLKSNGKLSQHETILYEWITSIINMNDSKNKEFFEANKQTISGFRNKRQFILWLPKAISKVKLNYTKDEKRTGHANGGTHFKNNKSVAIWFFIGILISLLIIIALQRIFISRGGYLLERINFIDRQYLGYFKALKAILDHLEGEIYNNVF